MAAPSEPVEPFAEEWLQAEAIMGGRFVLTGGFQDIRDQFAGLWSQLGNMLPPPSDAIVTNDIFMENGRRARIYTPRAAAEKSILPIGLYIHSGGFIAGAIEQEDHIARDIAERVPMILVSPDYRLAPENPFPAGLEDTVYAYKWVKQNAAALGASPDKVVIMGGSAGANLTGVTTLKIIKENPELKPLGIIIAVACTIHPDSIPSEYQHHWHPERLLDSPMINRSVMTTALDAYGASTTEPYCHFLLNKDTTAFPKTWLVACTKDPTFDEMLMLNDKLVKEGVDVELDVIKGYPHFFWMLPGLQKSVEFMERWALKVREMVA